MVSGGDVDQSLLPDLAVMGLLGGETEGANEWMGKAPRPAPELPKGLGAPPGQREVVELAETPPVFLPQAVQSRLFPSFRHRRSVVG